MTSQSPNASQSSPDGTDSSALDPQSLHKLPQPPDREFDHPPDSPSLDPIDADNLSPTETDLAAWGLSDAAIDRYPRRNQSDRPPADTPPPHRRPKQNRFAYSQDDIQALRTALQDNNLFRLAFYFLDYILRAQTALFEQIHRQQQLPQIIASMVILTTLLSSIYGLTMGMNHSVLQSIVAAFKLPLLFMLTAIICIPSLYTFNVLLGQRFKFLQTVTLMVMTLGTTCILLASLAPIAFFFSLTTQHYPFLLLLHVAIFGLCGIYGVQYLYRGCIYLAFRMEQPLNNLLLRVWIVIYGLVGMQLGWRLRPFVGSSGSPLQIFRPDQGGNFYIAVWDSILALFGGN
ncbi:MAG: hypothetical protein AB4042_20660 [Leptolyngbyaceae cyanobacterium]